jgi:hypothetical protein
MHSIVSANIKCYKRPRRERGQSEDYMKTLRWNLREICESASNSQDNLVYSRWSNRDGLIQKMWSSDLPRSHARAISKYSQLNSEYVDVNPNESSSTKEFRNEIRVKLRADGLCWASIDPPAAVMSFHLSPTRSHN